MVTSIYKIILLLLILAAFSVDFLMCYKILMVYPVVSPSHYILGDALAAGLVEAGHDVTMLSPYDDKTHLKTGKYTSLTLSGFIEETEKKHNLSNLFDQGSSTPILNAFRVNTYGLSITTNTIQHPVVKRLLASKDITFDAVIIEQFCNDGLKILAHHFGATLITFSTVGANHWVNSMVRNPSPSSYVPELFLSYSSHMTFFQRFKNFLFGVFLDLNQHLIQFPEQEKIIKNFYPNAPDFNEYAFNVSLVLLNSHESTNQAKPHIPNMISIGGFHLKPTKALTDDLQRFMDDASEGVIYFSMGSNLKSSQMKKETKREIFKAFRKLKQKVLWKWDDENTQSVPDNVKVSKWFPQQDILAHKNTKLFITHGGLLSTTETVYHGIPVLAIPVFGDQRLNAAQIKLSGYGLSFELSDLTEERLTAALRELLDNKSYRENVQKRSKIMKDRPMKPMETAIYWVEYVIRHKGAYHLRVAGVELPFYKYFLFDVLAVLFVLVLGLSFLLYLCIKFMFLKKQAEVVMKLKEH